MTGAQLTRRRWLHAAACAAAIALPRGASSQTPASAPNALVLVYRDQAISDESLARVVDFLVAAVPAEQWTRRETLAPGEALETLIDRALDYYGGDREFARPRTAAALVRAVRQGNDDIPSRRIAPLEVRLPPMPVRAHGRFSERETLRAFSAAAATYSLDQTPNTLELSGADTAATYRLVLTEAAGELTADGRPTLAARRQMERLIERSKTSSGNVEFVVSGTVASETSAVARADRRVGAVRDYLDAEVEEPVRAQILEPDVVMAREGLAKQRRVAVEARVASPVRPELAWATSAADLDRERDATTTAIVVPIRGTGNIPPAALPPGVSVLSGRERLDGTVERVGYSRIEFLGAPTCSIDDRWLTTSAHYPSAVARIAATLSGGAATVVTARARRSRLIIVDFDFTGAGHGNKVQSVILAQLQALGAEALTQYVDPVDLLLRNTAEKAAALKLLDDYAASGEFGSNHPNPYLAEAKRWIREDSDAAAWTGGEVNDLYLQAVLWRHLRDGAFVNISFRLLSPALRMLQPTFMQKQDGAFLVVAAGNDARPLDPVWVPQDAATAFANTINVTHGLPDGHIMGTRGGGEQTNSLVSLAAPGCGFVTNLVTAVESGSSLAAPYVVVAAWLKSLIEGGINGAAMRRELLNAAMPIPAQESGIESGGMFDAARLLAAPRLHLRTKAGAVRPLTNASLTVECQGVGVPDRRTLTQRPNLRQSVVIYRRQTTFVLWHRSVALDRFPRADLDSSCVVLALSFSADDGAVKYADAETFLTEVAEYAF